MEAARNLVALDLEFNQLTSFSLPNALTNLETLDLSFNSLTNCSLSNGFTNLAKLILEDNLLTNLTLPEDLNQLVSLNVLGNQLASFNLPAGLTNLTALILTGNHLTTLTLPPDMTQLIGLGFLANPLTTFVLSESMAASFAATVATLRSQGVSVFTYPLAARLWSPRRTMVGAFEFTLTGPPGLYSVTGSADLSTWHEVGVVTNDLGSAVFTDVTTILAPRRFYRALPQSPLANVVSTGHQFLTMRAPEPFARALVPPWLVFAAFVNSTRAQEVSIPDPGLNAAVRAALQKPSRPLREQDLLSLTNLDASQRNVSSINGFSRLFASFAAEHPAREGE